VSETKRCPKCGEEKPLEAFSRNRTTSDGRSSQCYLCWSRGGSPRRTAEAHEEGPFECVHCGKEFSLHKSIVQRRLLAGSYPPKFCSRECYLKHSRDSGRPIGGDVVCKILTEHHAILKDDPERLSTDFLKSLIGGATRDCEVPE